MGLVVATFINIVVFVDICIILLICCELQWNKREPDDLGKYLLAIWTPGETADSIQPPESKCSSQDCDQLCNEKECFSCNSFREANTQIVRGTLLIPCRTAMRGSFPLNGTYFQVNETMTQVLIQLVFPEVGSGTLIGEQCILEPPYHPYSKVYQHEKFNNAFGEIKKYREVSDQEEYLSLSLCFQNQKLENWLAKRMRRAM
ncbi:Transcriptional activator DEMETER [Glycine max]|nr:Transcriptional activator DEMETER [Glycine max]